MSTLDGAAAAARDRTTAAGDGDGAAAGVDGGDGDAERGGDASAGAAHARLVEEAFSAQAGSFEDASRNSVFTGDAEWLLRSLRCEPDDLLLDVAAGTGHAARSLAGRVRCAVAIDVTEAMLAQGEASAREAGIANVIFLRGDALVLPFLDESFDVVVTRFATHHIERPERQLSEMARCLRRGGRIALADMVVGDDETIASRMDAIERLRDPSHARMVSVAEVVGAMERLGLTQIACEQRIYESAVSPWLERANTGADAKAEIERRLRLELDGGERTGFAPREVDGELRYTQTWACIQALKRG